MFLSFNKLDEAILATDKILFVSHRVPDTDTVGSALALGAYAESLGKKISYFCKDAIPSNFYFLKNYQLFSDDAATFGNNYDLVIFMDCSELSRAGVPDILNSKKQTWISIDHHLFREKIGDFEIRDECAAANCEIIYKFLKHKNFFIDPEMATILLSGLLLDTGCLSNAATKSEAIMMASELCSAGADFKIIFRSFYLNKDVGILKLWGAAFERLKYDEASGLATTALFADDMANIAEPEEATGGLSNFLNAVLNYDAVMVLRESLQGIRGSIRSSGNVSAADLASRYGGGGHEKAAGFTCAGKIIEEENGWGVEKL
jgi:phosphoesterase RecJ-like protein